MTEVPLREVRRVVYRPLREGNALEDTVARLVQTIRLGVVAPGESLPPERELAGRYEVSRDTVREAIRELADTGFLVRRRGRYGGTFVADPLPQPPHPGVVPLDELDDVLGLRRVIEAGAARTAAGRTLTPEARTELWERHEAASTAAAADYRRLDTLLHLTIAEVAGIPSLVAIAAENRARVNAWLDTFPLLPAQHRALELAARAHRHRDPRRASGCRRGGDSGTPGRVGGPAARLPRLTQLR